MQPSDKFKTCTSINDELIHISHAYDMPRFIFKQVTYKKKRAIHNELYWKWLARKQKSLNPLSLPVPNGIP